MHVLLKYNSIICVFLLRFTYGHLFSNAPKAYESINLGFNMPVGVFDSGLGGLTVYRGIQKRMPDLKLSYIGDNMHAPYGVRDADDIYNLTCKSVERLWDEGCNLVILACNTATAVTCERMQE